ncbi:uncharacterized protein [Coffea arabica]|uniref:Transmembrane protein n=1 Tax=Coffea arabica TaxID=13443 RepID=A0ABM4X142_COFAR|nr:uncharacterized protein LOC113733860 isoform X1 [Coffea arabica]
MDHMFFMYGDFEDDIECCRVVNEEAIPVPNSSARLENPFPAKLSTGFDLSVKGGKVDNLGSVPKYGDVVCREEEVKIEIDNKVVGVVAEDPVEKCKSVSAKKPPKPPRPPRGLSLDAADQKLIRELAELAAIKRAKIERIKALRKMKAAKASPSSSSSSGSLFAMLCTVIFCVVIICQGMSSRNNAAVIPAGPRDGRFIAVQDPVNLSAVAKNSVHSEPPNIEEHASGLDTGNSGKRAIGERKLAEK